MKTLLALILLTASVSTFANDSLTTADKVESLLNSGSITNFSNNQAVFNELKKQGFATSISADNSFSLVKGGICIVWHCEEVYTRENGFVYVTVFTIVKR